MDGWELKKRQSIECIAVSCYLSCHPKSLLISLESLNGPIGHLRACRQERLEATRQLRR